MDHYWTGTICLWNTQAKKNKWTSNFSPFNVIKLNKDLNRELFFINCYAPNIHLLYLFFYLFVDSYSAYSWLTYICIANNKTKTVYIYNIFPSALSICILNIMRHLFLHLGLTSPNLLNQPSIIHENLLWKWPQTITVRLLLWNLSLA